MKTYQLLGIEEIDMVCELCNKKHIGKAYTFRNLETGDIIRTGSVCARKVLGIGTKELESMKGKFRSEITSKYQAIRNKALSDFKSGIISYDTERAIIDASLKDEIEEKKMYI